MRVYPHDFEAALSGGEELDCGGGAGDAADGGGVVAAEGEGEGTVLGECGVDVCAEEVVEEADVRCVAWGCRSGLLWAGGVGYADMLERCL